MKEKSFELLLFPIFQKYRRINLVQIEFSPPDNLLIPLFTRPHLSSNHDNSYLK